MENRSLEWKVGAFVAVGLVLLALLLVSFSKGVTRFARTYELYLRTTDVGGIKKGASVLMAGYPVGNVAGLTLDPETGVVRLRLEILQQYRIRTNAVFVIEQSGFLGDRYVAIYPGTNGPARYFEPGEEAECPPPFNLQQTARDAAGFIQRLDQTARRLDAAIADIRRLVLNEPTLVQVSNTLEQLGTFSTRAARAMDRVDRLLETQTPSVETALSNLNFATAEFGRFTHELNRTLEAHTNELDLILERLQSVSAQADAILQDLRAGRGVAGRLLADEGLARHVEEIAANLAVTTSNLNRLGLWRLLWKPRSEPARGTTNREVLRAPHHPYP
jgi:phospholipid/cholesterol/gamma-HCH transport system substrate-binding protein